MPSVIEMVGEYLKSNGYDGLAADECGCFIDDLAPCGEIGGYCKAGHRGTIDGEECCIAEAEPDGCDQDA